MEQKLAQLKTKLEADPSIVEKLFGLENPEEVQGLFKEQGLEFTLEEIDILREALVKTLEKGQMGDELTDDDLENVAGGFVVTAAGIGAVCAIVSATAASGGFVHTVTRGRW